MKFSGIKTLGLPLVLCMSLFSACKHAVTATDLYGKWSYTKVENPNLSPPQSVPESEIKEQAPYIEFTSADSLRMVWGGKLLSQGTFTVDGTNINYKELLPDGSTRSFPFYISDFKSGSMVFETLGTDASRVTVVRALSGE